MPTTTWRPKEPRLDSPQGRESVRCGDWLSCRDLGILLSSAAAGAAAAGLAGALIGMGISDDDAKYYDSEFRSGKTLVTVKGGANAARAQAILNDAGGYNRASRM